ncbi:MAG: cytochrome-c oxidase, cbb3-type subunit II [Betaproteobacteria bacterium]|nr:cytochrome-c oxidase, cbb3-type subunit II [Betaproteobacteria bacterium]
MASLKLSHESIEKNVGLMIVLVALVVSVAGFVQLLPMFFDTQTTTPLPGMKPYTALELAGRDTYVAEGCYTCHSQMIRPLRAEVERYGHYSVAGESVWDHPFQWGSKRNGPDLARVGGKYSDEWHRIHLREPRDVVPESTMPAYTWLQHEPADDGLIRQRMRALRTLGVPYTDAEIAAAPSELKGKTREDALVAYLQSLGRALSAPHQ